MSNTGADRASDQWLDSERFCAYGNLIYGTRLTQPPLHLTSLRLS